MVIEWLKFQVAEADQIHFLEQDLAIWTQALATQPGFISKEVWLDPQAPRELILVIRWRTREQWQSICPNFLAEIEARFRSALGERDYVMTETREFQPHKLSRLHVNVPPDWRLSP